MTIQDLIRSQALEVFEAAPATTSRPISTRMIAITPKSPPKRTLRTKSLNPILRRLPIEQLPTRVRGELRVGELEGKNSR